MPEAEKIEPLRKRKRIREIDGYKPTISPQAAKTLFGGIDMDRTEQETPKQASSPIKNKVGSLFVPVRDIERSRDWYCRLMGLDAAKCEIMNGHLCPLPMDGAGIILDTMPMWGGNEPGGAPSISTPAFMLLTEDLHAALAFARESGVDLVTEIMHDHWFVVRDPDGNKLMVTGE